MHEIRTERNYKLKFPIMIAVGVELLGVRVILSSTQSTHRHQEKPERIMCEREPITHTHTIEF